MEEYRKMQEDIKKAIVDFESKTEFMVQQLEIRRDGVTALVPHRIYGIYVPISLKG